MPSPRDEFRKVSPPKEVKKPSPPQRSAEVDEFQKVNTTKKSPPPLPKTELDEFRKVGIAALATTSPTTSKPLPSLPSKPSSANKQEAPVEKVTPPQRVSMSPPAAKSSPPREEEREVPPPLPEKPKPHVYRGEAKQESPKQKSDSPSVGVSKGQSDGDRKSITSTSSLASQSSRGSPPAESARDRSPASAVATVTTQPDPSRWEEEIRTKKGSPVRRQGEIDEDQPLRFRTRSGAVKGGSRGRVSSPGASQEHQQRHIPGEKKPELKTDNNLVDEFDNFQPRVRSRSGAIDSRTPPRRGGSVEYTSPPPSVPTVHETPAVILDGQKSADSQDDTTATAAPPSDDASQLPRMRTRSRAFHGESRRSRPQRPQQQPSNGRSIKEDSPTNNDDVSQPRMRTRSRALRGESQRPKKFARTPSPFSMEAQSTGDVQASLEVPSSGMRPRSSSMGRGLQRDTEFSQSASDTPKPDGEPY